MRWTSNKTKSLLGVALVISIAINLQFVYLLSFSQFIGDVRPEPGSESHPSEGKQLESSGEPAEERNTRVDREVVVSEQRKSLNIIPPSGESIIAEMPTGWGVLSAENADSQNIGDLIPLMVAGEDDQMSSGGRWLADADRYFQENLKSAGIGISLRETSRSDPIEMDFNTSEKVRLWVSLSKSEEEIKEAFADAGITGTVSTILGSEYMRATLKGQGFDVEPITTEENYIGPDGEAEWVWEITPIKTGRLDLYFTIEAIFPGELGELARPMSTETRHFDVHVSIMSRVTNFAEAHYDEAITGVFGWLFGVFTARYNRRRENKERSPNQEHADKAS